MYDEPFADFSLASARRLDQLCRDFEKSWHSDDRPQLESYLEGLIDQERRALLEELLYLELEMRRQAEEPVRLEEYLERFPQESAVVERVWGRSSTGGGGEDATAAYEPAEDEMKQAERRQSTDHAFGADKQTLQTDLPASIPTCAGKYEIVSEIASGGMGTVLRARDPDFQRTLAVKIMLGEHETRPELEERFFTEARITGQLQHPGVPPVHELGRLHDKRPFFAMKLIEGETLAHMLDRRRDPTTEISHLVGIFEQICQTIAFAHSRGIVHRDLKPANIMVGEFGEVQVMDWGLAKRLRTANDQSQTEVEYRATATAHLEETRLGAVLGTPAYMAPEQARGEIDQVDERSDVFGLGAILCRILTGKPPFTGSNAAEVVTKAGQGDVAEARQRLQACGADADLIALALNCLAPVKEDRPRNGSEVAAAVTSYLEQVQEKLRQAEVASAEARTKALEARKRLRIGLGLAGAVMLLILFGVASSFWYWNYLNGRVTQARELLGAAKNVHDTLETKLRERGGVFELQNDRKAWTDKIAQARSGLAKAGDLYGSFESWIEPSLADELEAMERALKQDQDDWAVAAGLGYVHERRLTIVNNQLDNLYARENYPGIFKKAKIGLFEDDPALAAKRIRTSRIREQLVTALDDWAYATFVVELDAKTKSNAEEEKRHATLRRRLLEIAKLADDDPWADDLRTPERWYQLVADENALKRLIEAMPPTASPQLVAQLGELEAGKAWLEVAKLRYPRDYSINLLIAMQLQKTAPEEAIGYYRAAVAVKPQSSAAYNNWGLVLLNQKKYEGAISLLQKAAALDSAFAMPQNNLGMAYFEQDDMKKAESHFKRAIALNPGFAIAQYNLGNVLDANGDVNGAVKQYQKAVSLDPFFAKAHHNLGNLLKKTGDVKGAMEHFQKAGAVDPTFAKSNVNLGNELYRNSDVHGAIKYYLKALDLDPNLAEAHSNLAAALNAVGDTHAAIEHCNKAISINDNLASAYGNLGVSLYAKKDVTGAIKNFQKALEIDSNRAETHTNLGVLLLDKGDIPGALKHCQTAVTLAPDLSEVHSNLGNVLLTKKDWAEAVKCYNTALGLNSKSFGAHNGLGVALSEQKDLDGAIKHLQQAIALKSDFAGAHNNLGAVLKEKGDMKSAATHFNNAIAIDPQDAGARLNLARLLLEQNDPDAAIVHLEKAMTVQPNSADVHSELGTAFLMKNDLAAAAKHLKKAIVLDPNRIQAHNNLAGVYERQGDKDGVIKQLRIAVAVAPEDPLIHFNLGSALAAKKDWKGAALHIEKSLVLDPNDAQERSHAASICNYNLATELKTKGDLKNAVTHLEKAIAFNPGFSQAYNNLGSALFAMGDLSGAGKVLQKCLALDPKSASAHCGLGLVYRKQGKFAEALEFLKKGHELGSKQPSWRNPSAQWISDCKKLIALEQKLISVLQNKMEPTDPMELLSLAEFCRSYYTHEKASMSLLKDIKVSLPAMKQWKGALSKTEREHKHDVKLQSGKKYVIGLESSQFDAYLRLLDGSGKLVGEDDDGGVDRNSQLMITPKENGNYEIVATSVEQLGEGKYALFIHELKEQQVKLPVRETVKIEPKKDKEKPPEAKPKDNVKKPAGGGKASFTPIQGKLAMADPLDNFPPTKRSYHKTHSMKLEKGKTYLIDLKGGFDTFLRIEDAARKPLLSNDDVGPPADLNSRLIFTPSETQDYRLIVTSFRPAATGNYSLEINEATPAGKLTLTEDKLTTKDMNKGGKYFKMHKVELTGGKAYTLQVESKEFDTFMVLVDAQLGQGLGQNDDIAPGNTSVSRLDFTPRKTGTYVVVVTSFAPNTTGAYTLRVQGYERVKK